MFGFATIPAALLFIGMLIQDESPHWLIRNGHEDRAREILAKVRPPGGVDEEIRDLRGLDTPKG